MLGNKTDKLIYYQTSGNITATDTSFGLNVAYTAKKAIMQINIFQYITVNTKSIWFFPTSLLLSFFDISGNSMYQYYNIDDWIVSYNQITGSYTTPTTKVFFIETPLYMIRSIDILCTFSAGMPEDGRYNILIFGE